MFPRLSELQKAVIFSVLVVVLALTAALVIRALDLPNGLRSSALYMGVPAVTALVWLGHRLAVGGRPQGVEPNAQLLRQGADQADIDDLPTDHARQLRR